MQDAAKGTEAQRVLGMHLTDERIEGFCKVSVCENVTESAVTVMHHAGIGSLQPNTVSWPFVWYVSFSCCVFFCRREELGGNGSGGGGVDGITLLLKWNTYVQGTEISCRSHIEIQRGGVGGGLCTFLGMWSTFFFEC